MKQLSFIIISLLCSFSPAFAQDYTIKGVVMDTLNNNPLHRASIVLIRAKDSVIQAHTRTAANGSFEIHVANKGKYMLRISFPSFVDYLEVVDVKKSITDIGEKPLVSKEHLLKEFVLTQQIAAIKIKGDTTEYMADSFRVKENATVEDLLKKLPGIQVDKNGNITAQGETVQKILVDGEEFFSDDPKVVTKGLQADAVEKVQVFNKKSDQAEFTGIDDGQKTKTINLELKAEKKKGYFGKLDAGGGTDGYYQNQGMINAFRAKRQFSAFGIMSNTDKVGLGWRDNDKFGGGNGVTEITDAGIMTTYTSGGDDDFGGWGGNYNGEGLPRTWTGGAHYADKWNADKNHVTGNYRYALQDVNITGNNIVQNTLHGDSMNVNDQQKVQSSRGERHSINAMYELKIDSNTTVKITANAGFKKTETFSMYNTNATLSLGSDVFYKIDSNHRVITNDVTANFINADVLLKRKFSKKGRTLSLDLKENYKNSESEGTLNSRLFYFATAHDSVIDQRKENRSNTLAFSGKATYTEPLSKKAFVEISYGATVNNNDGLNYSYNLSNNSLDSGFSSHFKYNILSNTGGLNFKFMYEKINFSFGSDVSNTNYLLTDRLYGDTTKTFNYLNLFPKVNFTYNLSKQTSLNFYYAGNTVQPSFTQIQPLRQNANPLNVTIGNPNLQQGFDHRLTTRFNDYKVLSNRYFWSSFSFTYHERAISTEQTYINGVNTTRYINVDGNYSGWGYAGYGFKIKKLDLDIGLQLNGSLYHVNNRIGTQGISGVNYRNNTSDNRSISFGPYFNYSKEDKLEFSWNPSISYNNNTATIGTSTKYSTFNNELSGSVQLPLKFEIGSSVDIMIREKTPVFTGNNDVVKWNAWVGKKFLKKSQLEVRASVFDILNQNLGFERSASGSVITQDSYNTIRRYGMLNIIWNFTHTPAGAPPAGNSNMIIIK